MLAEADSRYYRFMRAMVLGVLFVFSLFGQDAGMVLRTSVGYNSTARSLTLAPEVRERVEALGKEATRASAAGDYGQALKVLYQGTALMRGREWTPAVALAASLMPVLDHAVWEPGQKVTLSFKRLYPADEAAPTRLPAKLTLRPAKGASIPVAELSSDGGVFTAPSSIATGAYQMEIALPVPKTIEVSVAPGAGARSLALEKRLVKMKAVPTVARTTAEYLTSLFGRADRGELRPEIDFDRELKFAEEIVSALENGRDPLNGRKGDLHLAYVSKVDDTAQPYRLYVPKSYKEPVPLVVALHGMGGDENTLFDRYGSRAFQEQAEKYGWLVVAPKGRDAASMYRGAAEQDVLDVVAEVRKLYRVDDRRIYAMGHSMGGYGTWSIAQNHPGLFAALGPIAGGGNPARMKLIASIPQIVVHGDADKTVLVTQSRGMVEAARQLGTEVVYVEVPGGEHNDVVIPNVPKIFEFFAGRSKKD